MLTKKYRSKVISVNNPLPGVYSLELESLGKPFKYRPGQFLHLSIDNNYDGVGQWPVSRCFSMQSNPSEKNIRITYSIKGSFTAEMMQSLEVGSYVWLKLPYGDLFEQDHVKEHTVFIAGGTGVTPFLSLFTDDLFIDYINPKLYLGLRSVEFNIYQKDLIIAKDINPNLELNIIYQDSDGILEVDKIFDQNGADSSYFISGPPNMIRNFKKSLVYRGVPGGNIFSDDWE